MIRDLLRLCWKPSSAWIAFNLMVSASSCDSKITPTLFQRSCADPTSKDCLSAGAEFLEETLITNNQLPTWTWKPKEGIETEYTITFDGTKPSRTVLGFSEAKYQSQMALQDGDHAIYIWTRASATETWTFLSKIKTIVDTVEPVTPSGSALAVPLPSLTQTGLTLEWSKASDDRSLSSSIQYKVIQSLTNNISTVADAEANGQMIADFTADVSSLAVTGLSSGTTYFFNVIVRDEAGNKVAYTPVSQKTVDESTAPVAGSFAASTAVTATGFTLNWTAAVDNVTLAPNLQYRVCSGASAEAVDTIEECEAIAADLDYTPAATTLVVTGKSPLTTYYYNVIVRDAVGSKSIYNGKSQTTLDAAPNPPTAVAGAVGNTSVDLSWTAPTSNGGSAVTDYIIQHSSNGGTSWNTFNDGTSVSTTANVTDLTNGTGYIFRVAAVNTAGSGSYSVSSASVTPAPVFVTRWNTNNTTAGSSNSNQIRLPLVPSGTYNFVVDWGDGSTNNITSFNQAETTHTYSAAGTYTLKIRGTIAGWQFNNTGDRSKILNISAWGPFKFGPVNGHFYGANNLTITATDIPDLTGTTSLTAAFYGCSSLTTVPNMSGWNVSAVTSMNSMFMSASAFNQNIGGWDTGSVTTMASMFAGASAFNQNIGSWNVAAVTDLSQMFHSASAFNQNIGGWQTASARNMSAMFYNATSFNQNISSWNTAAVLNMSSMFSGAGAFNQNIGSWSTSAVTDMSYMFERANSFNQDIGSWNVSKVTDMSRMFKMAGSFRQNLGSWDVTKVTDMTGMFEGGFLGQSNYDQILLAWSSKPVMSSVRFHGGGSRYSASAARGFLTGTKFWLIDDGGAVTVPNPSALIATVSATTVTLNWTSGGGSTVDFIVVYQVGSTAPSSCWSGMSTTSATNSVTISGLTEGTQYSFRACARTSGAGQVSGGVTVTSTPDGTAPTAGSFSTSVGVSSTGFTLTWTPGSDNATSVGQLTYRVCSGADAAAIDTVTECDGAATELDYSTNITTLGVTGKAAATTYYFNVIVSDASGLKAIYNGKSQTTSTSAPGAPTALTATAGNTVANLTWSPPSNNGGSAILDYIVQYSSDSGGSWTTFVDGTSITTTATVTDLTNGTAYIFRVAAVNEIGTGANSANSSAVTPAFQAPGAPTAVTVSAGNTQVTLSWTAPTNNGGSTVTNYSYQYSSNGGANWTVGALTGSTSTSYTVTGLTNGTSYLFRVAAVNAIGTGSYSSNSPSAMPGPPPDAPTGVTGSWGHQMASLYWTTPADNGPAITDYIVQYSSNGGGSWSTFSDGTSAEPDAIVTGLNNGTAYVFRVAAVNGSGTGSYSANSASVTPACAFRSGALDISSVASGGKLSTGFYRYLRDGSVSPTGWMRTVTPGDQMAVYQNLSPAQSSHILRLTNLTSGDDDYWYRNDFLGQSGSTCIISATQWFNVIVKSVPADVTGIAGSSKIILSWAAPNGGAAVTDYYYMYSSDSGVTWSSPVATASTDTTYIVAGLSPGTSYIFKVAAVQSGITGTYSANSAEITTIGSGCAGDCYLEGSSPNYAQDLAIGTEMAGPAGTTLTLQYSNGTAGFKIWKEKNGNRILNASGYVGRGWQQKLGRLGIAAIGDLLDTDKIRGSASTTIVSRIGGRICPTHVFLNHANMMATNRCLYHETTSTDAMLDQGSRGFYAEDWLTQWDNSGSGLGASGSYYEGNIKICADKGMRLPTLYETNADKPATNLPTGDSITPIFANDPGGKPGLIGTQYGRTASAHGSGSSMYWNISYSFPFAWGYFNSSGVLCVLPGIGN